MKQNYTQLLQFFCTSQHFFPAGSMTNLFIIRLLKVFFNTSCDFDSVPRYAGIRPSKIKKEKHSGGCVCVCVNAGLTALFGTRRSRAAALWASQRCSSRATQSYLVVGLLLENNNWDSKLTSFWRSCVINTCSVMKNAGFQKSFCCRLREWQWWKLSSPDQKDFGEDAGKSGREGPSVI